MSARGEDLARRFEQVNQEIVALIGAASNGSLRRICEEEGWTAAAVAAHVADSHDFLIDQVRRIVDGEEFPPFDSVAFHKRNRCAAAANAALSAGEVMSLLTDHTVRGAAYLRSLGDDDLDRTKHIPVMGDQPVSAQQWIEWVLIGHAEAHLRSLRQALA